MLPGVPCPWVTLHEVHPREVNVRKQRPVSPARGIILEHELQGLSVQIASEVKAVDHVQLIFGHVHKMLVQMEGPDVLRVEASPLQVALVRHPALPLARGPRLACAYWPVLLLSLLQKEHPHGCGVGHHSRSATVLPAFIGLNMLLLMPNLAAKAECAYGLQDSIHTVRNLC